MIVRSVVFALLCSAGLASAADQPMSFELYPDAKTEFRWRLKDGDGKIVATSGQGYARKADCKKMCENFAEDISKYAFEVYESKDGFRWRINAKNGNTVGASSGGFKTKDEAEKSTDAVKAGVKGAKVVELEKDK